MATLAQLLAAAELPDSSTPTLDAELLLAHALGQCRSYLRTWPERQAPAAAEQAFLALLARRRQGEPVAYLLGSQGFWDMQLKVSPATLIPRPETELLVATALELLPNEPARVLDLGTGSGAIALALAKERPAWQLLGVDVSTQALAIAEENARQQALPNLRLAQGDWFSNLAGERFELIVSNPPYVASSDAHLQRGDLRFEPLGALAAGADGLDAIGRIVASAPAHLHRGGWLLFEHGFDQGPAVRSLLQQAGFGQLQTRADLAGLDRITLGHWHV